MKITRRIAMRSVLAGSAAVLAGERCCSRASWAQDASRIRIPTVEQIRARGEDVWKLVDLINAYRRTLGLAKIPLSPKLTAVAAWHVKDLAENEPHKKHGSLHSWSTSDRWTGGAYRAGDAETYSVMWNKPREIAGYDGTGYEVAVRGARDLAHALEVWKKSPPHHDVIINRKIWKDMRWQAVGAVFHKGFACAWFGEQADV